MMETTQTQPLLRYADLEQAFADAEECLTEDLSAARITLIRDVHYDDYELEILIYGQNGTIEDAPIVQHTQTIPDEFLIDTMLEIKPDMVIAFFDADIRQMLIARHIPIEWNTGEASAQVIDLKGFDPALRLLAEDR